LDRFGLSVTVTGEHEPEQRVEVIKRRLAYEQDSDAFSARYRQEQAELGQAIIAARQLLPQVTVADELLMLVANLSIKLAVDGHRADITVIKTALTLAAFAGRTQVFADDIKEAARLTLPHRMRRRPFEAGVLNWDEIETAFQAQ
jgi:Mg-chelatase subunit ChlI